jgi:sterol desaturase/sphingolipid hydroxylase (fatty acid hydroxylase superfamily)
METIIDYFSSISSLHRGLILAGGIAFFWLLESVQPMVDFNYKKWNHAGINIFFTLTTIIVNFLMAFVLLIAANWTTTNDFGLLQLLPKIPLWLYTLIGLLFLDLIGAYLAHLSEHKIKLFWRFHLIHHTDTWIDTTSANRHHPGESVIRFIFTTFGVFALGCPMWMVFLYQSLSVVFSQLNHANIALPKKIDWLLSFFLVSPDMHKVHHHYLLPFTDSNYGNIFSVWDRLFGTFSYLDRKEIVYGIDTHHNEKEHNDLKNLLMIPFQKPKNIHK